MLHIHKEHRYVPKKVQVAWCGVAGEVHVYTHLITVIERVEQKRTGTLICQDCWDAILKQLNKKEEQHV